MYLLQSAICKQQKYEGPYPKCSPGPWLWIPDDYQLKRLEAVETDQTSDENFAGVIEISGTVTYYHLIKPLFT